MVPTKTQRSAVAASFDAPEGAIEPSGFSEGEAEQVRLKFLEEQKGEEEAIEMALHDRVPVAASSEEAKPKQVSLWRSCGC